LVFWRTCAISS